ncbi:MAG: aspartate kinase [Armatimonadetes bacterium]|nr:aspartate kinase [Armatimonadota bacterium]NOG39725.1 aspartate kinase [Armatimonadota bacterium]GIK33080.1 MAG: aspartokinase [Armatimonadota bacterium]
MSIVVLKFGGTSVSTPENRRKAAAHVLSAKEQGYKPVVVVSAIGREESPYSTDTLLRLLQEVDPTVAPDPREVDLMIACGEILSATLFAHTLKTMGQPSQAFRGGQAGIRTDGVFGNARIVSINPLLLSESLEKGNVPVVCGFQGTFVPRKGDPGGELTTLGRGGSDTTAAVLGAALGAERVEVYTDVDGVKTADPDHVPNAPTLRKVTYDEVAEIAHLGAKVLHPRAAEIAMKFGIPLWVKNTFSDDPGTEVVDRKSFPGRRVTGVTHSGRLAYLQFNLESAEETHRVPLESRIYETMARYDLNVYMMNHSRHGFGFAMPREEFSTAKDLIDGLVLPIEGSEPVYLCQLGEKPSREVETQADLLRPLGGVRTLPIDLTENCTMVSVIGQDYLQQPGVYHEVLTTLHEQQVAVLQTSDSERSLSCLIPYVDVERAVRALHERFELSKAQ